MGTINIYNNTGSNKNSLEFNGNTDSSVNTEHLTATTGNVQTQLDTKATITNSASAPSNPSAGDMWYDSVNNIIKHWNGTTWLQMSNTFSASGGTEGTFSDGSVNYKFHRFTSSGTFTANSSGTIDILVVAGGGGGGGGRHAAGAGAGGLIYQTGFTVTPGDYSIVVGAGGTSSASVRATNGNNSTALSFTAIGGGRGGSHALTSEGSTYEAGTNGGSGGGSAHTAGLAPGSGTSGQGFSGSRAVPDRSVCPSGGGAGGTGVANGTGNETSSTGKGDDGGPGLQVNVDGNNYYYAGGGGGSGSPQAPGYLGAWAGGAGGIGGGGGGASSGGSGSTGGAGGGSALNSGQAGVATTTNGGATGGNGGANTGGGGGGAAGWSSTGNGAGGFGGSGIVVIRYAV